MKLLILIILMTLQTVDSVYATENTENSKPWILLEAEIYRLDVSVEGKDLQAKHNNAVLESSPVLSTMAGKKATIEVGVEDKSGEPITMMTITFISNDDATKYDLDFVLLDGKHESISHIKDFAITNPLTLSATLNNVTKLITMKTTIISEEDAPKCMSSCQ